MLADLAGTGDGSVDWAAHYWLLSDVFGRHPTGVDEEHFVTAMAALTAALLDTIRQKEIL